LIVTLSAVKEQEAMSKQGLIGGSTFIFAPQPGGFGAQFMLDENGDIRGIVTMDDSKQGPPGHAHGGSLAALIDEAMGAAAWNRGHRVLAANLNINYRRPVPLGTEITLVGRVDRTEGRKIYTSGAVMMPDREIAVEGTGLFIEAPQYFGVDGFNPFMPVEE